MKKSKNLFLRRWHPTLNGLYNEGDFGYFSEKKAWFICDRNHCSWTAIRDAHRGHGCPYCMNKKVCLENSLSTVYPALAKEWHPRLNGLKTPQGVVAESGYRAWWQCEKGHYWQASVQDRAALGKGCPYCHNRWTNLDNCLAKTNPILASQWHPTKNKPLTPFDVTQGSGRRVWWLCNDGTEWMGTVNNRSNGWSRCPSKGSHTRGPGRRSRKRFQLPSITNSLTSEVD